MGGRGGGEWGWKESKSERWRIAGGTLLAKVGHLWTPTGVLARLR